MQSIFRFKEDEVRNMLKAVVKSRTGIEVPEKAQLAFLDPNMAEDVLELQWEVPQKERK